MHVIRRPQAVLFAVTSVTFIIIWLWLQSAPDKLTSRGIKLESALQTKLLPKDASYDNLKRISISQDDIVSVFLSSVNSKEAEQLSEVFLAVSTLLQNLNISYFLYRGTLIGAIRHHNRVPWDDDFDVAVSMTKQTTLANAFKNESVMIKDVYIALNTDSKCWKLHRNSDHYINTNRNGGSKYWPYVDVCFYKENATHIWDAHHSAVRIWLKRHVFPLVMVPFEGTLQPVPCDVEHFVSKTEIIKECILGSFNHRTSQTCVPYIVACRQLYPFFPFVQTIASNKTVIETLVINGTVLDKHISELKRCS